MNRKDFNAVITFLEVATGKPIVEGLPGADDTKKQAVARIAVYFELLGDLPLATLRLAAKQVALQHRWASFPSAAEIRQAAAEILGNKIGGLTAAEAWAMVARVADAVDPSHAGSYIRNGIEYPSMLEAFLDGAPEMVRRAVFTFGIAQLCDRREPIGVVRAQFTKTFETLAAKDQSRLLLPAAMQQAIANNAAPETAGLLEGIGQEK